MAEEIKGSAAAGPSPEERVRAMKAEELLADYDRIMLARALGKAADASITWHYELRAELLSRLSRVEELQQQVAEIAKALNLPAETASIASCNHIAHVAKQARENAEKYFGQWTAAEAEAEKAKGERDEANRLLELANAPEKALLDALDAAETHKYRAEAMREAIQSLLYDGYFAALRGAALTPEPAQSGENNATK